MATTRRSTVTDRTRATVLAAASDLLIERGVGAVTIDAVIQRSGVARSTIYRHWPTRTELVAAAFDNLIHPPPSVPPPGPLGDRLRTAFAPIVEAMSDPGYTALASAVLGSMLRDPELGGLRERFVAAHTAPVRMILADATASGELAAGADLDVAVSLLVGPVIFQTVLLGLAPGAELVNHAVEGFLRTHAVGASAARGRRITSRATDSRS